MKERTSGVQGCAVTFCNATACICVMVAVGAMYPAAANAQDIAVYLSQPGVMTSSFSNVTTETFNGITPGIYSTSIESSIGTYELNSTDKLAVMSSDQYGSGTGNYVAIGAESHSSGPVTLVLPKDQNYFGLAWDAGDAENTLSFYDEGTQVGYYSTSTIMGILQQATVTALNGSKYNSSQYYGQPVTHQDTAEPFAYINFIASGGAYFDEVVFGNSNTTATGFESDNHAIASYSPTPETSSVYVGSAFASLDSDEGDSGSSATPEPGALALIGGCATAIWLARLRRKGGAPG